MRHCYLDADRHIERAGKCAFMHPPPEYGIGSALSPRDAEGNRTLVVLVNQPHTWREGMIVCEQVRGVYNGTLAIAVAVSNVWALCDERHADRYEDQASPAVILRNGTALVEAAMTYVRARLKAARQCRLPSSVGAAAEQLRLYLEGARVVHGLYGLGPELAIPSYSQIAPDLWEYVEWLYQEDAQRALPPREPNDDDIEALMHLAH